MTDTTYETQPLWVVYADGDADLICETSLDAKRHAADLRKMGHQVRVKAVTGWAAAERLMEQVH